MLHSITANQVKVFVENDPEKGIYAFIGNRANFGDPPVVSVEASLLENNCETQSTNEHSAPRSPERFREQRAMGRYAVLDAAGCRDNENLPRLLVASPHMTLFVMAKQRIPM